MSFASKGATAVLDSNQAFVAVSLHATDPVDDSRIKTPSWLSSPIILLRYSCLHHLVSLRQEVVPGRVLYAETLQIAECLLIGL